ncbi:MAG: helix-turn-helix transcriptional regulator [Candidatus Bathyarchaeota archaeon]|nr:helix-turn-helix transcriptional regulator [Candidatus Bathyarchaeota archaeon]
MSKQISLSIELRKLIESKLEQTLRGIEDTFSQILKKQDITPVELKENVKNLEENFSIISQKWSLEILYTLLLKDQAGFGEIKKILGVNSRTLSDKLKTLDFYNYINRKVINGPPLRVQYSLTDKGKNTVLLALPLLYFSSK